MRGQAPAVWRALIVVMVTVMPSNNAGAQELPGWRIKDICAKDSDPGQCAAFEGRAFNAVSGSWAFVLEPIKQACLAQVKSPLDQSWRLLAECLEDESQKAVDKGAVNTARTPAEPVPPPMIPPPLQIEIPPAPEFIRPAESPRAQ